MLRDSESRFRSLTELSSDWYWEQDLDGRFIRLLLAPARGPARMMTAGLGLITNALTKILGAQVLRDMQTFVAAFDTLFGGFRQRAQKTFALLQAPGTAFVVVAAPEPDALREAAYFVDYVQKMLTYHPRFDMLGKTVGQRTKALFQGGLRISTTVDLDFRAAAYRSVSLAEAGPILNLVLQL